MRVKLVSVQVEVLAQLLGLPEDCQIVGVRDDTNIITFKVMSPEFPEVRHPDKVEYMLLVPPSMEPGAIRNMLPQYSSPEG